MKTTDYDCIIIGGGAAGLTAAIYTQRYGMKTLVISKELGGATAWAGEIENYPGFIGSGRDLMNKFEEQAKKFGTTFELDEVLDVTKQEDVFTVKTTQKTFTSKTVISGLGSKHRELGIPGEHSLLGKGVSVCATCDGNFFRNKTVMIVGGGDAAAKAILYLSDLAKKVYVSYRKEPLKCEPLYLQRIKERKNVELLYNTELTSILGEKKVTSITMKSSITGKKAPYEDINLDGVFIEIGADPIITPFKNLGLTLDGNAIAVDKESKTNIEGFFAAGDGVNNPFKQTITAAAAGAVAAKSAYDYVQKR